ncbi:MAG TPA: hypothetical protein VF266_05835 [Thermoanaerobaculia bacterium]
MSSITVTLDSITCHGVSEGSHHDEVYVVYQPDAGFPHRIPRNPLNHQSMQGGDVWTIGQSMTFTRDLLITLYDQDESFLPALSDYLVSWDYTADAIPQTVSLTNPNGASYTLSVSVDVNA